MSEKSDLPRSSSGEKMYPVCKLEGRGKKLREIYHELTGEEVETTEDLMDFFNAELINGMIYAEYPTWKKIKIAIGEHSEIQRAKLRAVIDKCDIAEQLGWEEFEE